MASDATGAVIAHSSIRNIYRGVVDDDGVGYGAVVDLNVRDVGYIIDRAVVIETISIPVAALVADADVAESVVDAAVIADVTAPESIVKAVSAAGVSPIARRP